MSQCPRCLGPTHVEWVDVSCLEDAEPRMIAGRTYCLDPTCMDRRGYREVARAQDGRGRPVELIFDELTAGDRAWVDYHLDLARRVA